MDKPVYDTIAEKYKASKLLPFRYYIERYTLFKLLGDLTGKKVLDLACGEGIYTRLLKENGAARAVGVDISPEMIRLAQQEEQRNPLGCEYVIADVECLTALDEFDLVLGSYLLNYAKNKQQLLKFCRAIYKNLGSNGRFVGFNDNLFNEPEHYADYKKYGFIKKTLDHRGESDPITYVFFNADGTEFSIDNYYLHPQTYHDAFIETGFYSFNWAGPWLSPEGKKNYPESFWQEFLLYPPMIGIEAKKSNK